MSKVTVKFEKNWSIIGMTICLLLNILNSIDVIPIESLKMSSLSGMVFFMIVYFVVKQQEQKSQKNES